jgi:hypothetical protein
MFEIEVFVRAKKLEGISKHTITNYNKLFNNLGRCFAKNKHIENFTINKTKNSLFRIVAVTKKLSWFCIFICSAHTTDEKEVV